jgi:hypothetical protein
MVHKVTPMNKHTPQIEWHIGENDAEWARLCAHPQLDTTPAAQGGLTWRRFLWSIAVILLVLIGAGG